MDEDQRRRYARQIILPELGEDGQRKLLDASVLIIGAGGLGSVCALYLAAAGVGRIGLIDPDRVELSNLQRQILYETADIDEPKVSAAKFALNDLNPFVKVETHEARLDAENAATLFAEYDVIADGCDDIATRFIASDVAAELSKKLVHAAVQGWEGYVSCFKDGYSLRSLYPEQPPADAMPSCSEAGIMGAVCGVIGSLQATEVIKEITGVGESLAGKLLRYDGRSQQFSSARLPDLEDLR